jgi:hypothetical protein
MYDVGWRERRGLRRRSGPFARAPSINPHDPDSWTIRGIRR